MTGAERIAAERQRQIEQEGWTPEHDDQWEDGQLIAAAMCYSKVAECNALGMLPSNAKRAGSTEWPWDDEWWKPSDDPIRNLEKAGALLAAEIDRLQRIATEEV